MGVQNDINPINGSPIEGIPNRASSNGGGPKMKRVKDDLIQNTNALATMWPCG